MTCNASVWTLCIADHLIFNPILASTPTFCWGSRVTLFPSMSPAVLDQLWPKQLLRADDAKSHHCHIELHGSCGRSTCLRTRVPVWVAMCSPNSAILRFVNWCKGPSKIIRCQNDLLRSVVRRPTQRVPFMPCRTSSREYEAEQNLLCQPACTLRRAAPQALRLCVSKCAVFAHPLRQARRHQCDSQELCVRLILCLYSQGTTSSVL